jgi:hypothetical protein
VDDRHLLRIELSRSAATAGSPTVTNNGSAPTHRDQRRPHQELRLRFHIGDW